MSLIYIYLFICCIFNIVILNVASNQTSKAPNVFCMNDTLYDLVNENIERSKLPDMSHFSTSVVTRAQAKADIR